MTVQSALPHERSCCSKEEPERIPKAPRNSGMSLNWHQIGTILVAMLVLVLLFLVL